MLKDSVTRRAMLIVVVLIGAALAVVVLFPPWSVEYEWVTYRARDGDNANLFYELSTHPEKFTRVARERGGFIERAFLFGSGPRMVRDRTHGIELELHAMSNGQRYESIRKDIYGRRYALQIGVVGSFGALCVIGLAKSRAISKWFGASG